MISEKGFILENGTEMPFLGFGTYLVQEEKIILDALASGYRHIDTARRYENEKMIGNALQQCGLPRRELFLTSKVWKTDLGYDKTMASFEASLKDLQVQYLDLFLIHWPLPFPGADWKPLVTGKPGYSSANTGKKQPCCSPVLPCKIFRPQRWSSFMMKAQCVPSVSAISCRSTSCTF